MLPRTAARDRAPAEVAELALAVRLGGRVLDDVERAVVEPVPAAPRRREPDADERAGEAVVAAVEVALLQNALVARVGEVGPRRGEARLDHPLM